MTPAAYTYPGGELHLFERAVRWKAYWRSQVQPYIAGDVLEVGAGLGVNTGAFSRERVTSWTCLEPDPSLLDELRRRVSGLQGVRAVQGTLVDAIPDAAFDCILYIDVLEHIEDDRAELERAHSRLRPNGHLVVLSPAYTWLFSPFDAALGHFRRYSAATLRAAAPTSLDLALVRYLDSVGVLASLGNRLLLRQSDPTTSQIQFWDTYLVPASRVLDRCLGYACGKSVLAVWRK